MTRDELYSLVWRNPAVHVAKQLGVSSARLRKVCEDYGVPLPPPGYWAKRAHGKDSAPPPLPQQGPTIFSRFNSALRRFGEVPLHLADIQIGEFDAGAGQAGRAAAPSPHAAELARLLGNARADQDGFIALHLPHLPDVNIGVSSVARTVAAFAAVLRGLEQQGYGWKPTDDGHRIVAEGENFALKFFETRDKSHGGEISRPSGRLVMEIVDTRSFRWSHRNQVGLWHDLAERPLETSIRDAMTAIAAAVPVIRLCRVRAEEETALIASEAESHRSEEARRAHEAKQRDFILTKAKAFADYRQLMEFERHLRSLCDGSESANIAALLAQLGKLIAERGARFGLSALDDEIVSRGLNSDRK